MTDREIVYDYLAGFSFNLVMNSKYVTEMFMEHNITYLSDFNTLRPARLYIINSMINRKDPKCETGFAIAFDKEGHYPIIGVNEPSSYPSNATLMDIQTNFIKDMFHEIRHLVQFYETCIQMGSISRGIETYNKINKYVLEKYPWPFTPLENDALNTMYTIDPFNDFYDSSVTPLIQKLIAELDDREEDDQ